MRKLFALILLGAMMFGLAVTACAEPVKLEYKFVKDDVTRYMTKIELKLQLPEIPGVPEGLVSLAMSAQQAQKVVAAYPDGSAKLKTWTGDIKMTSSSKDFPMPKDKTPDSTSYMKMSKLGRILAMDIPQAPVSKQYGKKSAQMPSRIPGFDTSKIISMFGDLNAFPAEPIEIGATWSKPIPLLPDSVGSIELNNTLISIDEQFTGMQAAKVNQTLSSSIDLAQAARMIIDIFAGSIPGSSNASKKMPYFKGDLNVTWTSDVFFSVEQGKLLGQVGVGKIAVNIKLPAEAIAQGAPSEINAIADIKVEMTKI